jgi:hypothetical protein
MRHLILFFGVLLCFTQIVRAETWTLVDKQDREIVVDQLFYDGVNLSVHRVGAYNKIKIPPDMLSKQCWTELNQSMAKEATISLEVVRRTKTSTDSDRNNTSGYYSYSSEEKSVRKLTFFDMSLKSSSHFVSEVAIEYFIISEDEVDCGRLSEQVSFAEPLDTSVSKAISHTERNYKSSYGYSYSYKDGDSKASAVVLVYDAAGDKVAEYATSNKLLDEFRGMERGLRSRMNSGKGNKKSGEQKQITIDRDLL